MIFRALFWIGLVSLLAPHEPDLGFGHPGAGTLEPSLATIQPSVLSRSAQDCGSACAGGLGLAGLFHLDGHESLAAGLAARLAEVKAEIEADRRMRRLRAKPV